MGLPSAPATLTSSLLGSGALPTLLDSGVALSWTPADSNGSALLGYQVQQQL
ncbi:MAG: fibronectin type III domain-containing protein [Candidatus Latescibacteria bacterium]|nr:fibronectin type III domain-containing protein [Candidatus Latescibacterota bacterium]